MGARRMDAAESPLGEWFRQRLEGDDVLRPLRQCARGSARMDDGPHSPCPVAL